MAKKKQKLVNLDAEVGELLRELSEERGIRQQHVLSVSTLFYMASPDEVRGCLDAFYKAWREGRHLQFLAPGGRYGIVHPLGGSMLSVENARSLCTYYKAIKLAMSHAEHYLQRRIADEEARLANLSTSEPGDPFPDAPLPEAPVNRLSGKPKSKRKAAKTRRRKT